MNAGLILSVEAALPLCSRKIKDVTSPPPPAASEPIRGLTLASSHGGGAGNPVVKVGIAALIVVVAIGAYVYFGEKPPVAYGEVIRLSAYPVHRISNNALAASPNAAKVENTFDEVILVAQVRLHNQSHGPLFLSDMSALLSLTGEEDRSLAANSADFNRVFLAYPELAPMRGQPLLRDTTIPAGAIADGQLIFNYPITKEQWELRRSLDITISFLHQKDLVLPAPQ